MIFDKCILQKEALSISTSWGCSIKFYNNFIQKRILAVLPLSGLERAKVEPEVEFPLHKTPIPAPELLLIGLISISKVLLLENLPTRNQTQEKRKRLIWYCSSHRKRLLEEYKRLVGALCAKRFWIREDPTGKLCVTFLHQRGLISTAVGSDPLRAERRRREARREIFTNPELVTARRSILGPPAEGRPGPSTLK